MQEWQEERKVESRPHVMGDPASCSQQPVLCISMGLLNYLSPLGYWTRLLERRRLLHELPGCEGKISFHLSELWVFGLATLSSVDSSVDNTHVRA